MTSTTNPPTITPDDITNWVDRYLVAWKSNATDDIAALFTAHGEYHERPYETDWVGRDAIVAGWQGRWDWQEGGWGFEWQLVSLEGATAVISGVGTYAELGTFDNLWTVQFETAERCRRFDMVNTERDAQA
jgi:hypothetical protein